MASKHGNCIRIEAEYADGTIYRAVGEDAKQIMDHIDAAEVMNYIHGINYTGPTMQPVAEN